MWQGTRVIGLWALLIGCVHSAWALTILPGANDSAYTSLAQSPSYVSVGRIDGSTATSNFLASGTLIDPSWVLTAAHVVDDATKLTFSIGGETYTADRMYTPPQWNGNLWAGYDIGLVHLSMPVANVKPAALYTGDQEWHKVDTFVGYGMTGNGITGATTLDGAKRAAQNVIDQLPNARLMTSEFDKPMANQGGAAALPLEGLIAPGDSGGGLFLTTPQGTFLAGVNSFVGTLNGSKPNSAFGDISGDTRVSAFDSWIDGIIKGTPMAAAIHPTATAAAGEGAEQPCAATSSVPEPGTLALGAFAALLCGWHAAARRYGL